MLDVVIPLYNKERFIYRAVASVLGQTVEDLRVTVIDDGSTDGGRAILEQIGDPRLRVVGQANAGPGRARNHGLALASAPYVAFLDADDHWRPNLVEAGLGALEQHSESAAYLANWRRDPQGIEAAAAAAPFAARPSPFRLDAVTPPSILKRIVDALHSSAIVVRRDVASALGGFFDGAHCTYGEDAFLWLRLLLAHSIYADPGPVRSVMDERGSTLGARRKGAYPVPPLVSHAKQIINDCPASHRRMVRRYLRWYSLWVAARLARQGEPTRARLVARSLGELPMSRECALPWLELQARSAIGIRRR